jgi:hypothetical protein
VPSYIAQPFDEVEQFALTAAVNLGVEDLGDFVLKVAFDFNWCGRFFDAIRDCVRRVWTVWFEHRDVEDGMAGA